MNNLIAAVQELQKFIVGKFGTVRHHIKNQLEFPIAGPKNMSKAEEKFRQMCRINLHVYTEKCKGDGHNYESILTLYERQWHDFMGYYNPACVQTLAQLKKTAPAAAAVPAVNEPQEDDLMENDDEDMAASNNISIYSESDEDSDSEEQEDPIAMEVDGPEEQQEEDALAARARIATEAAQRSPPPDAPPPVPDVEMMGDLVEDLFGNHVIDALNGDEGVAGLVLGEYTRARLCGVDCQEIDHE